MLASSFQVQRLPTSNFTSNDPLPTILLIATPLAVIAVQYARRRTALARSLILALMAALVLISVAAPYRKLINRQYPPLKTGEQPPFQLRLGRNSGTWQGGGSQTPKRSGLPCL
jgi:hypothetical protein